MKQAITNQGHPDQPSAQILIFFLCVPANISTLSIILVDKQLFLKINYTTNLQTPL